MDYQVHPRVQARIISIQIIFDACLSHNFKKNHQIEVWWSTVHRWDWNNCIMYTLQFLSIYFVSQTFPSAFNLSSQVVVLHFWICLSLSSLTWSPVTFLPSHILTCLLPHNWGQQIWWDILQWILVVQRLFQIILELWQSSLTVSFALRLCFIFMNTY